MHVFNMLIAAVCLIFLIKLMKGFLWLTNPTQSKEILRLRAVPLFSYSPSRAERKKQAARKLAARKLSERKAKKGTTDKASAFDLCVAPTTQKCDWLMLDSSRQDKGNNWIAVN